jgi:hypothetical protein
MAVSPRSKNMVHRNSMTIDCGIINRADNMEKEIVLRIVFFISISFWIGLFTMNITQLNCPYFCVWPFNLLWPNEAECERLKC